ncbi:hypothetical protein SARC_12342 [Sphaeroforma arctica JP610]|uniref:U6 snRNA-associated Sm-like protein LSm8 n=1 Tax=Sphaeroforma arctica JP610 TaxID=667725 RepID=A0A0L0FF96_9EUKA|nr:hypothetical protein SARC_12342 [Sphaeroforma arctica JP610]KNC75126.1 hypothetical protein SARC_12342 [Sphaeroforma arctica JP610]|eukprot:XP_014149028.1 hypothetical protein SARC_12342 [Sphaeroforma arctica JP610]
MAASIKECVDKIVSVVTQDGRLLVGQLKGYDQNINIVLRNCHERVYHPSEPFQKVEMGSYIVRGDNLAVIGELEEELDNAQDFDNLHGETLKPVVH